MQSKGLEGRVAMRDGRERDYRREALTVPHGVFAPTTSADPPAYPIWALASQPAAREGRGEARNTHFTDYNPSRTHCSYSHSRTYSAAPLRGRQSPHLIAMRAVSRAWVVAPLYGLRSIAVRPFDTAFL
eukprot:5788383-Prymnesium_polylepis.1